MSKPRPRHYASMAGGSKHAMKKPQRGLGVAELERIRLHEEQQEQLLYRASFHNKRQHSCLLHHHHQALLVNPSFFSPHSESPLTPHFCIPQAAAEASISYSPISPNLTPVPTTNPNSIPILITNSATIPTKPACLTINSVYLEENMNNPALIPDQQAVAAPEPPSFVQNSNPYIIVNISPVDQIIPHAPNTNLNSSFMSSFCGSERLFNHAHQQEHSFFPVYPSFTELIESSCNKALNVNAIFQSSAKSSFKLKYHDATATETEELEPYPEAGSFPSFRPPYICVKKLSPALQNSKELELPSFQKQQGTEIDSMKNRTRCGLLDLNCTHEEFELASCSDTKLRPWNMDITSKDTTVVNKGSSPRDNFLKLGPPTTIESKDKQLIMHTNMMKCFKENQSSDLVKANLATELDLNLKLSLPSLDL